jgi:hypothetical protein
MSRIGHLLVQPVEDTGVVLVDESSGEEVFIDVGALRQAIAALVYFAEQMDAPYPPASRR